MPEVPTLAECIRRAIEVDRDNLHVALPGRIKSYNPLGPFADVELVVQRARVDGAGLKSVKDFPVLPNVMVQFPRGGTDYAITWPLAPGDHVLVVFCETGISQWRSSGEVSDPGDLGRHTLSNAVAIPGIGWTGEPLAQAALPAMVAGGADVRIGGTGILAEPVTKSARLIIELLRLHTAIVADLTAASLPTTNLTALLAGAPTWPDPTMATTKAKAE